MFETLLKDADMVIVTGERNYAAFAGLQRPLFFLFTATLPDIMRHINALGPRCHAGESVLYYRNILD